MLEEHPCVFLGNRMDVFCPRQITGVAREEGDGAAEEDTLTPFLTPQHLAKTPAQSFFSVINSRVSALNSLTFYSSFSNVFLPSFLSRSSVRLLFLHDSTLSLILSSPNPQNFPISSSL